jgi:hypothetical protein
LCALLVSPESEGDASLQALVDSQPFSITPSQSKKPKSQTVVQPFPNDGDCTWPLGKSSGVSQPSKSALLQSTQPSLHVIAQ